MAADTRASSSVDDLIVPGVTGNGKQHKTRTNATECQEENGVDERSSYSREIEVPSLDYICMCNNPHR